MPKYTVASPLLFDGERYEIGRPVSMDEKQAAILLEQGVLSPAPESNPAEKMTVAELTEALEKLQVEIPQGAKKAELAELYNRVLEAKE